MWRGGDRLLVGEATNPHTSRPYPLGSRSRWSSSKISHRGEGRQSHRNKTGRYCPNWGFSSGLKREGWDSYPGQS